MISEQVIEELIARVEKSISTVQDLCSMRHWEGVKAELHEVEQCTYKILQALPELLAQGTFNQEEHDGAKAMMELYLTRSMQLRIMVAFREQGIEIRQPSERMRKAMEKRA